MESIIHIIVLFAASVLLFGLYLAMRTHTKKGISQEDDFITKMVKKKEHELEVADSPITMSVYSMMLFIAPLILGIAGYIFTRNGFTALLMGIIGFILPEAAVRISCGRAKKKFEIRYVRALEQMASSLRSDSSIINAVEDVVKCRFIHMSIRRKFAQLSADIQMGSMSVSDAFMKFAKETESEDALDVAIAVSVQSEVGGKEAEVIMDIARSIRSRIMMRKEVKSILASSSSLVLIMDFVPLLVILFLFITSRQYINIYFENPAFTLLLVFLIILPITGSIVNHSMLRKLKGGIK